MITDHYCKTTKKRVKETIKEQDTPQNKERLKNTPLIQENQDKAQHRRATTSHRKAIPKEQQIGADFIITESHDHDEVCCRSFRSKFRHLFTLPDERMAVWLRIQHDNTQEGENYRKTITNRAMDHATRHSAMHYQLTHGTRSSSEDTPRASGRQYQMVWNHAHWVFSSMGHSLAW